MYVNVYMVHRFRKLVSGTSCADNCFSLPPGLPPLLWGTFTSEARRDLKRQQWKDKPPCCQKIIEQKCLSETEAITFLVRLRVLFVRRLFLVFFGCFLWVKRSHRFTCHKIYKPQMPLDSYTTVSHLLFMSLCVFWHVTFFLPLFSPLLTLSEVLLGTEGRWSAGDWSESTLKDDCRARESKMCLLECLKRVLLYRLMLVSPYLLNRTLWCLAIGLIIRSVLMWDTAALTDCALSRSSFLLCRTSSWVRANSPSIWKWKWLRGGGLLYYIK